MKTDPFSAIADANRRKILSLLAAGALSVNSVAEQFDVSRPAVSKHIKVLQDAGLVTIEESGRERYCSLNPEGFREIREWLLFYERFWGSRLAALGSVLDNLSNNADSHT